MFTRIALFLLTNIAVLLVASVVLRLLGIDRMVLDAAGEFALNYTGLFIFSAIFGFGGAFLSLLMSKWMAKRVTRTQIIDAPSNPTEVWLLDTTRQLARSAGIETPEVGIFPASEPNAFATGARRNKSLVAVSEGLLRNLRRDEVRAVLGHEIGHVANGDMVTLTLLQGILNTFVIFFSRVVGFFRRPCDPAKRAGFRDRLLRGDDRGADRIRHSGQRHRDVVFAPPGISGGCGRRPPGRTGRHDQRAGVPEARLRSRAVDAGIHGGFRDFGFGPLRYPAHVLLPPAAGGPHPGAEVADALVSARGTLLH